MVCREWICFFFKQKRAYELRISDWSSDVCSSNLLWCEALGLLALGIAIELAQYAFTSSRSMDPRDVLADALGVAAGFAVALTPLRDLLLRLDVADRKSVVEGKSVSVRVDLGGRRFLQTKNRQLQQMLRSMY